MIVLDEQLQGRSLEKLIARWYPVRICFVNELRPGSVIKDDAIPHLLSRKTQPTFITINELDFWHRVKITDHFCVVCVALPDARITEAIPLLQQFFRHRRFSTKAKRMGHVVRLSTTHADYYSVGNPIVQSIENW